MIFILNDNLIELIGLKDEAQALFVNDAAVTVTLVDANTGAAIAGQAWPTTLVFVTGSNGDYRGILSDALVLTDRQQVVAKVDAVKGVNNYHAEIQHEARVRRS